MTYQKLKIEFEKVPKRKWIEIKHMQREKRDGTKQAEEKVKKLEEEISRLKKILEISELSRAELGKLSQKLCMLTDISQNINTFDLGKIHQIIVTNLPNLLETKYIILFSYDYKSGLLSTKRNNCNPNVNFAIDTNESDFLLGMVKNRNVVFTNDEETAKNWYMQFTANKFQIEEPVRNLAYIPLRSGDLIVGCILAINKLDGRSFTELNDLPLLNQISNIFGIAIRNTILFELSQEQSLLDELTKVLNYRAFIKQLSMEIHRATRYSRNLSMLIMDLDNFKHINDKYGHLAGNEVLVNVAQKIRNSTRREDIFARFGGDEFALLLPETDANGAIKLAERITNLLRQIKISSINGEIISISIGIAQFKPGLSQDDFIKIADFALYQAKNKGKNCYVVYSPALNPTEPQSVLGTN